MKKEIKKSEGKNKKKYCLKIEMADEVSKFEGNDLLKLFQKFTVPQMILGMLHIEVTSGKKKVERILSVHNVKRTLNNDIGLEILAQQLTEELDNK